MNIECWKLYKMWIWIWVVDWVQDYKKVLVVGRGTGSGNGYKFGCGHRLLK